MVDGQLFEKLNTEYVQFWEDGGGGGLMVVGGCESICGEGDGVSNWTSSESIEDEEVSLVDGVLEGALGALDFGNGSSSGGHECVWLLMMSEGDGELVLCIWREFMGRDLFENGMNLDKFREFQMLFKHSG
ncbi:hypothetical protein Tco_0466234 [Tanacetum coccineum]